MTGILIVGPDMFYDLTLNVDDRIHDLSDV